MASDLLQIQSAGEPVDVLVVGAGPAGIAAALSLWSLGGGKLQVAWADPTFTSGRMAKLENVHCNTKLDLMSNENHFRHPNFGLVKEVEAEVQRMCSSAHHLEGCTDPSQIGWTRLGSCRRIFDAATRGILASGKIQALRGTVVACVFDRSRQLWESHIAAAAPRPEQAASSAPPTLLKSRNVIFATGSEPRQTVSLPPSPSASDSGCPTLLDMEEALDLEQLRQIFRSLTGTKRGGRVAVLGNSHSAALVLSNLRDLSDDFRQLKVTNVVRREVRFAEWMESIGSYKWNSTGLKGYGAVFGRAHMVPGTKGSSWMSIEAFEHFRATDYDFIVDCTGYVGTKLPKLSFLEVEGSTSGSTSGPGSVSRVVEVEVKERPAREHLTGRLEGLPAAYAVGAPWGEPAGILWGKGYEKEEGFASESSFIGFRVFTDRSNLIVKDILLRSTLTSSL